MPGFAKRDLKAQIAEDLMCDDLISLLLGASALLDACDGGGTPKDWQTLVDADLRSFSSYFKSLHAVCEVFISIAEDRRPAPEEFAWDDTEQGLRNLVEEACAIMDCLADRFTVAGDVSGAIADTANMLRERGRANFGLASPKVTWEARAFEASTPPAPEAGPQTAALRI